VRSCDKRPVGEEMCISRDGEVEFVLRTEVGPLLVDALVRHEKADQIPARGLQRQPLARVRSARVGPTRSSRSASMSFSRTSADVMRENVQVP
jgi:hypothetical protein